MLTPQTIDEQIAEIRQQLETLHDEADGTPFEKNKSSLEYIHISCEQLQETLHIAVDLPPGEELGDALHKMRTPLSVIIGFAEIWANIDGLNDLQSSALDNMHKIGVTISQQVSAQFDRDLR